MKVMTKTETYKAYGLVIGTFVAICISFLSMAFSNIFFSIASLGLTSVVIATWIVSVLRDKKTEKRQKMYTVLYLSILALMTYFFALTPWCSVLLFVAILIAFSSSAIHQIERRGEKKQLQTTRLPRTCTS